MKYLIIIIAIGITGCISRSSIGPPNEDFLSVSRLSEHELSVLIDMNDPCDVAHKVRSFFMEDESGYIYLSNELEAIKGLHSEGLIEGYETISRLLSKYRNRQLNSTHVYLLLTGNKPKDQVKREIDECYYSLSPKGRRAVKLCIALLSEKVNELKRQQDISTPDGAD